MKTLLKEDEEEYWEWVRRHGSEAEKENAADYFGVSVSDLEDMSYAEYIGDHNVECDEAKEIDPEIEKALKALATDDYQNRGGNYPESGVPDVIDASRNTLNFSFKNTSEDAARNWVSRFLTQNGLSAKTISAGQTGDYEDDWVDVYAEIEALIK